MAIRILKNRVRSLMKANNTSIWRENGVPSASPDLVKRRACVGEAALFIRWTSVSWKERGFRLLASKHQTQTDRGIHGSECMQRQWVRE